MNYFRGNDRSRQRERAKVYQEPPRIPKDGDPVVVLELVDSMNSGLESVARTVLTQNIGDATLPNARVGEPFDSAIRLLDPAEFRSVRIEIKSVAGLRELGLRCEITSDGALRVSGAPNASFEGSVFICFGDYSVQKKFAVVASDPYDLWQNNEPPEGSPYPKEHRASQGSTLRNRPPLRLLVASARGRSHAHNGLFRDDDFCAKIADDSGWSVFAVADGAGSARFSREGSRIACQAAVVSLYDTLNAKNSIVDENLKRAIVGSAKAGDLNGERSAETIKDSLVFQVFYQALYKAHAAIHEEVAARKADAETPKAESLDLNKPTDAPQGRFIARDDRFDRAKSVAMRDYSTTLLLAAIKRFPPLKSKKSGERLSEPTWAILTYWVGDGALALYRPNGEARTILLGTPDEGEYAGETRFVTDASEITEERILPRLRATFVGNFKALVMATDGISDPFFPTVAKARDNAEWDKFWLEILPRDFPGALDPKASVKDRADALLKGLDFKSKGNHDDRTLLLVVNDGEEPKCE
ncbi:MAG: protein phosphatase 2C domain-containing protein [Thermoguttaceae bacterium]|nr:protein phosphatase 2C domain-containing protein [Thermoguttaceae bacterium]